MPHKDPIVRAAFQKEWRLKNKENIALYKKQNKEKILLRSREYELKNKEKRTQVKKKYHLENLLKYKVKEANYRYTGKLTLATLQLVYEDNIKKYGTLTCYLCLKPIPFSEDSLDHKIAASKGGTNDYNNLGVAHKLCNNKKRTKTDDEYREVLNG